MKKAIVPKETYAYRQWPAYNEDWDYVNAISFNETVEHIVRYIQSSVIKEGWSISDIEAEFDPFGQFRRSTELHHYYLMRYDVYESGERSTAGTIFEIKKVL